MAYEYYMIYNVSKNKYAHNVSGNNDATKIWDDNEWEKNDALIGFYSDDNNDYHFVIFCLPGYAIFVQSEENNLKKNFNFEDKTIRIPPAILINLNNAYDTEFIHSKIHSSDIENDESCNSHIDDESEDESEDEIEDKDSIVEFSEIFISCKEHTDIILLLEKYHNNTNNIYKQRSYNEAIVKIINISYVLNIDSINNLKVGKSIKRKITEYLERV